MTIHPQVFKLCLVPALILLASCVDSPPARLPDLQLSYKPSCERVSVFQHGREILPVGGVLHIARAPFSVRFLGQETEPSLVISKSQRLNSALTRRGRKEIWASAGDFMAHYENDLGIRDEAHFFISERSRSEFAAMIGDGYAQLLQSKVADNPALDTATYIPKTGGFVAAEDGKSSMYKVATIDSVPVSKVDAHSLHLTYFATVEKYAPTERRFFGRRDPLLLKTMWGSCVVAFSSDA